MHLPMFTLCLLVLSFSPAPADEAEDKVVELIRNLGGIIERDPDVTGMPVILVDLDSKKITNEHLKELAVLSYYEN